LKAVKLAQVEERKKGKFTGRENALSRHEISLVHPIRVQRAGTLFHYEDIGDLLDSLVADPMLAVLGWDHLYKCIQALNLLSILRPSVELP